MDNKFIILLEKFMEKEATAEEEKAFLDLINNDPKLREEYEEQKRIKEVMNKMSLENPSKEFWDAYWLSFLNKFERGVAWFAIVLGTIIILGYGIYHAVQAFLADTHTPGFLKFGIAALFLGGVVLLISVLREKLTVRKYDKYKEIQR